MPSDEMPERIWAFEDYPGQGAVPRSGMWCDEQSETPDGSPCFIRADLCASGQQVRALEWEDWSARHRTNVTALTLFGRYNIIQLHFPEMHYKIEPPHGKPFSASSLTEAKAAAQADYERRILAALTPAPQPSAATPTAQEAVPVAWRIENLILGGVSYVEDSRLVKIEASLTMRDDISPARKVTPLFAHPPQPSEAVADTDAIAKAIAFSGEIKERRGWDDLLPETRKLYRDKATAALRALKGGDANG